MTESGILLRNFYIPLHSTEALWEWHVPTDELWLSMGVRIALNLDEDEIPATMTNFLAHLSPDILPALYERREGILSGNAGSALEIAYHFGSVFVRERMLVLERNAQGRALVVIGHHDTSGTFSPLLPHQRLEAAVPPQAATGYWQCSFATNEVRLDSQCAALLGHSDGKPLIMSTKDWKSRLHPEDGRPNECRYQLVVETPLMGDAIEDFLRVRTESGSYKRVRLNGAVLERNSTGRAVAMTGTLRNAEVLDPQASQENGRLLYALNATGDGLWDWDSQTDTVYYSPRYLAMLGYTAEEFPGTLDVWKAKIHPDDYPKIVYPQRDIVESPKFGDTFECTYRILNAYGSWTWILGRGYVTHRDSNGRATRLVGMHTNITSVQNDREKLENLVKNDALTGLRSRNYCDLVTARIEKDRVRPISIISCDINGLKLINDHMGHAVGDALLSKAALLLRHPLRATDCISRMGGDEFLILLTGCPESKAQDILHQIERKLAEHNADPAEVPVLISLGLACADSVDIPLTKVLIEADRKMLLNKAASRKSSQRHIKDWIEQCTDMQVSLEDNRYDA